MQQLFQSVSTKKFLYNDPEQTLSMTAQIEFSEGSHILAQHVYLTPLNWLAISIISILLFMMNPQLTQAQSTANHYVVRSGDTLTVIAYRHKTSVRSLINANNLTSDLIHVGDLLIIPTAPLELPAPLQQLPPPTSMSPATPEIAQPPANVKVPQSQPTSQERKPFVLNCSQAVYTVQRGDTLYSIAIRSNSNITRIKRCNNLHSDSIWAGQILVGVYIPATKRPAVSCNRLSPRC